MTAREILSKNLQELMHKRGIDQLDLAKEIGVSQSSISQWIKGNKYPRIDKIQLLADFFNVPKSRITEEYPQPETIAAHKRDNLTEEEQKAVDAFIQGLIANRKN
ncbi:XRE family transcriptional regulator [Macrococcoides goetzii]|nr:helix-turn-helix transcriptional regulator [Macrococcus goetzii]TDM48257.1 XRE family transcriptional regulator [Macrococcus goetzii]